MWNEDSLIEQPAIEIFKSLGYDYLNCYKEVFAKDGTLGRETASEVVLASKLMNALSKLNPDSSSEAISLAIEELTRDRSVQNPAVANKEIYKSLRDGVKATIKNEEGNEDTETIRIIDFNNPQNKIG